MTRAILVSVALLGAAPPRVNNGISFIADRYYFELSYGQGRDFYVEQYLPGSTIWKLQFKSILRIELPPPGASYRGFSPLEFTQTSRVAWNPSKNRSLATFGEYVFILSPEYHILAAYRNTEDVRWLSDDEIQVSVETGGRVSKYERSDFAINVRNDRYRKLH